MPMGARTQRGGNRNPARAVEWGRPKRNQPTKVLNPHAAEGARTCPTCDGLVGVRKDGRLRSHRVGKDRRNSWPCLGEEKIVFNE